MLDTFLGYIIDSIVTGVFIVGAFTILGLLLVAIIHMTIDKKGRKKKWF